jgi:hypothetical protein
MRINHRGARLGVCIALAAVAVLGACGDSSSGENAADRASPPTSRDVPAASADDSVLLDGVNALANASHVAAVATVIDVGAPYDTTFTSGDIKVAKVLQEVTVRLDRVVYDSGMARSTKGEDVRWSGPAAETGQTVVLSVDQTGEAVTLHNGAVIAEDKRAGTFTKGENMLVLLRRYIGFPGPTGTTRDAYTVLDGWQGHWTIEAGGATAKNVDGRKVALEAFIKRLQDERTVGRHAERDRGTYDNPTGPASS